jgi:hypothetical protein
MIFGMSLMLSASTRAQTPRPIVVPPPAQAAAKRPPRRTTAPAFTPPPRAPDPELDLPDTDTAKRVTGLRDEAVGGADCRTACDKAYYICLPNDPDSQCQGFWTQCLRTCPTHSSNF